jgi:negative regulator of flagellin synthesis FlgM
VPSKINGLNPNTTSGAAPAVTRAPAVPTAGGGAAGTAPAAGTEVRITDTATRLAALEQALRDAPAVDEARVAELRSAIEQGRYTVQPEHIASQLLQLEQALAQLPGASAQQTAAPDEPGSR